MAANISTILASQGRQKGCASEVQCRRGALRRRAILLVGAGAIVLTFVAGALQQAGYSPTRALTHNAFFHVLQLIALAGLFLTARYTDEVH